MQIYAEHERRTRPSQTPARPPQPPPQPPPRGVGKPPPRGCLLVACCLMLATCCSLPRPN
eukprot:14804329-Alexandrium_andersonii.AAC.1